MKLRTSATNRNTGRNERLSVGLSLLVLEGLVFVDQEVCYSDISQRVPLLSLYINICVRAISSIWPRSHSFNMRVDLHDMTLPRYKIKTFHFVITEKF
jgi:hypothetical protein